MGRRMVSPPGRDDDAGARCARPNLRGLAQAKAAKICLQLCNRAPGKNPRVLALVRRIGRQLFGPAATTNERKQWPLVQPSQVNLGFGACTTADDDAGIAGKGHQKIACIAHAAREDHGGWPIRWRHLIRRHDAENQAIGLNGALSRNLGRGTAATAYDGDTELGQRFARLRGELIRARARFGAAKYANLRFSVRGVHG